MKTFARAKIKNFCAKVLKLKVPFECAKVLIIGRSDVGTFGPSDVRTFPVFQAGHSLCSKQDIPCVPSRTFLVFQAGHSVCSKQYIACVPYHHIIISSYHHTIISSYYHHNIISSYHHIIITTSYHHIIISSYRQTKKVQVSFGPKVKKKIQIDVFTPPPKIMES